MSRGNMQTKIQSMHESWVNVFVGYIIGLVAQLIVFPLYDLDVSINENLQIAFIFTCIALLRNYAVRRFFNNKLTSQK